MTPPDWIDFLFSRSLRDGSTFFLIGDSAKVLGKFRAQVEAAFPGIRILGHQDGFFDHFGKQGEDLVARINALRPDYVLVGMGMPLQEKWIDRFLPKLECGIYLPVGALYRWYVGEERRAPKWVTDNGLEWLARLISNPADPRFPTPLPRPSGVFESFERQSGPKGGAPGHQKLEFKHGPASLDRHFHLHLFRLPDLPPGRL